MPNTGLCPSAGGGTGRINMQSQEMLEQMMRANIEGTSRGSRAATIVTPMSTRTIPYPSVESVIKSEKAQALFDNEIRLCVIQEFVKFVESGRDTVPIKATRHKPSIGDAHSLGDSRNVTEAAFALGRWSMDRFHTIMNVREVVYKQRPPETLANAIDSLNWAIISNTAADEGIEDEEADTHVWNRYSIPVDKSLGPVPQPTDPESVLKLMTMRENALQYFQKEVQAELKKLSGDEIGNISLYITKYRTAATLMELVFPLLFQLCPEETITLEIIPRIMVLAVLQADSVGAAILNALVSRYLNSITPNAANSALEFSAHLARPVCSRVLMDHLGSMIVAEGVISAMIPCCARGSDHLLAMLELFIMDKCQQLTEKNLKEDGEALHTGYSLSSVQIEAFAELVPPCAYLFLVLATGGGYAKPATLNELIEFYQEPCEALLIGRVSEAQHLRFVDDLFYLACQLNFTAIVWTLIKAGWGPPDCTQTLAEAVASGHQSLVHILLDSVLVSDEKLHAPGDSVPVVFRKSKVLTMLPQIAQRFPSEASWFLGQLSSIPMPSCIPLGENQEAQVRATTVKGTRLGVATLGEVARRTDTLNPIGLVWKRLKVNAQLRRAAIDAGGPEAECVICMAPEAFLTEEAAGSTWFAKTSPFIRLLESGNEEIILQPIMQALMEYHWVHGNFWYRFAGHFLFSVTYIACMWTMFVLTISRQVSHYNDHGAIVPLAYTVLFLTSVFVVQEFRECLDDPKHYVRSFSNMMDMMVYTSVTYCAIKGSLIGAHVPPLLLGFTLVVYCTRVLMQLRIIPSIGPIIRIWVSATKNILPVLVPFCVLALSFAGAFHLTQMPLAFTSKLPNLHFQTIPEALQSVLTMTAGDYSVLDFAQSAEVFSLRLLFHVIFIIFLINLIIGLMTVNVANVTVNITSAWLVEIAQLMVELELYWPWPMGYRSQKRWSKDRLSRARTSGVSGFGWRLCNWCGLGSVRENRKKVQPEDEESALPPIIKITGTMNTQDSSERLSIETTEFLQSLQQRLILYTCPEEQAAQTHWWKNAADKERADENESTHESRRSLVPHSQPGVIGLFGLGDTARDTRVASVPSMIGRSLSSLPPVPSEAEILARHEPDPFNFGVRTPGEVMRSLTGDSDSEPFLDVRNRRSSRAGPALERLMADGRRHSIEKSGVEKSGTDSNNALTSTPPVNGKEVVDQLVTLKESFQTTQKIMRADARALRDYVQKIENTLLADRQRNAECTAGITDMVKELSSEIRQLTAALSVTPQRSSHDSIRQRIFGNRGD
ncbi:hypothetical protein DFJ77DRAFT_474904 [Powellomyces hirtus]|nr:hypothetical protein DFJ77DRAFT_474904 [Powellomyces hirtus]